jgi:hypothetical protein
MIHNLDSSWKDLIAWSGLNVDDNTNTNIVVADIFNWALSFDSTLQCMECQLQICKAYCLILSLKKSRFFLKCFEFVGVNVSPDGNRPAMSKHIRVCSQHCKLHWFHSVLQRVHPLF